MLERIDYLRVILYGVLFAILWTMLQAWQKDHPTVSANGVTATTKNEVMTNNYVPVLTQTTQTGNATRNHPTQSIAVPGKIVTITTDVMQAKVDAAGNIIEVKLLKYPETLHSTQSVVLLNNSPDTKYIAQSGLLSNAGPDTTEGQAVFTPEHETYTLTQDQTALPVVLHWRNAAGVDITKTITFHRNSYEVEVAYQVNNRSKQSWAGSLYLQLMRTNTPPPNSQGMLNLATYFGSAISSKEQPYEKITFKDMQKAPIDKTILGGWAAMIQHYFVSAWIPDQNISSRYFTRITRDDLYTVGMINPSITVNPGETVTTHAKLFSGPAATNLLEQAAPGLQLTVDFGWFWFISSAIFWMMQKIYDVVGNWGWSIVFVTLIIKLLFYGLSAKSYRSMAGMKKLQPRITALKERFGDDKQKLTQETLALYKKEKVNPMSGCLPILIQIPVFIGLYWVLVESVQLRQAPFIFWIHDLSIKDPYFILPVLMGISMFLQQRLNPPPADPMQAKIMMLMPVVFTAMFLSFPAGLMLYWFVNNTVSFLQQWYIMRRMEK